MARTLIYHLISLMNTYKNAAPRGTLFIVHELIVGRCLMLYEPPTFPSHLQGRLSQWSFSFMTQLY